MVSFHPLRIEVEIVTPIVHGNYYPIHLDGLVYWAIRNLSISHELAIQEMDQIFSKSRDIYHASQALFIKNVDCKIIATEAIRTTVFSWKEYDGVFSKVKKSIKENEGVFRKMFTERLAIRTNKIVFYALGDESKILFYLNSLVGIGKSANAGFGEIGNISISKCLEDYSWFYDDKLNRILPTSIFTFARNEPIKKCRFKPNYTMSESTDCYMPINNVIPM